MKPLTSYIVLVGFLVSTVAPTAAGLAGAPAAAGAAKTTPALGATPADGGWPRAYEAASGAKIVLYEPQVASWLDQKRIVLYSAVSYRAPGKPAPALGTIRVEADTKVAVPERLVNFSELTITASNFPTLGRDELTTVVSEINASVPRNERVIGLDRVLAALDTSQVTPKNVDGVKADAPRMFSSEKPAILVNIDGPPIWSPIKDNDLRFAVNTNWDLFEHAPSKTYFLRAESSWMSAASVDGQWTPATTLPSSFSKLPDDENWKDVKSAVQPRAAAGAAPAVFVSTQPAELLLITGAPKYAAVAGTGLSWVSNTESDVFRLGEHGPVFFLVSGRWFTAPAFQGPWTFATPSLPEDFKRIPLEHPRSRVLASVPGTTQALEAVLLAQVPQIATVKRAEVKAPEVVYQGEPQFEPIDKTSVARAVNTDKDIIKAGDLYYMCVDGVWFMGRSATGPWIVADAIPPEIYEIPISSPAYSVTNVTVESSSDDEVEFAATAAYSGMMVGWGCAMWGTGYYYDSYYWGGGYYPVYYPRYPSYGYGARYNPWTGAFTRAGAVYGPYGGAGYAARYNPSTGTYARGTAAWGPGGARGAAEAWNPRTGTSAQTRQGANVYGSWGSTAVQRGDQWASTSRVTNRNSGTTTRATQGSGGGGAVTRRGPEGGSIAGKTGEGNMYAGRDGNVYRNTGDGWQKYDNGSWNNAERPTPTGTAGERATQLRSGDQSGWSDSTRDQLKRDQAARSDGARRTQDLGRVNSGSGSHAGAGSYRPSGGSFGGGGGGGRSFGGSRGGGRR